MTSIVTRTGKGAPITQAENDSNLDSLCGINESQTGTTYTVSAADQNGIIEFSNASPIGVTLALIATIIAANDTSDFQITLKNIGIGLVTITPTAPDTFDDTATTKSLEQYEWITIQTDSTQTLWNVIASSNALRINGFEASQFLRSDADDTTTGDITISKAAPQFKFTETDVAANDSKWRITIDGSEFHVRAYNGAETLFSVPIKLTRAAQLIPLFELTATDINLSGQLQLNGADVTADAIELSYNDITTLGTVQASKTVTADGSGDISQSLAPTADNHLTNKAYVDSVTGYASSGVTELIDASVTISAIPSWATKVQIVLVNARPDGSTVVKVQLGDAGGIETAGYNNIVTSNDGTGALLVKTIGADDPAGFVLSPTITGSSFLTGTLTLSLIDAANNLWVGNVNCTNQETLFPFTANGAGYKSLSGVLTQLKIIPIPTRNFVQGDINVFYYA